MWGRGRGCSFLDDPCVDADGPLSPEFCVDSSKYTQCDYSHSIIGRCQFGNHFCRLPEIYQYFKNPTVGGSDYDIDFCPIVEPEELGHC